MRRVAWLIALGALGLLGAPGLACDTPTPDATTGSDASTETSMPDSGFVDATPEAASDATPDGPLIAAPVGWHKAAYSPPGCDLFVPDQIGDVEKLSWDACPTELGTACSMTRPTGWDVFAQGLTASTANGAVYASAARSNTGEWSETVLTKDGEVVGAWRAHYAQGRCFVRHPWVEADGRAAGVILRRDFLHKPTVLLGPADTLSTSPEVISFEALGHSSSVDGWGSLSSTMLLQHEAKTFSAFGLKDGWFDVPIPDEKYLFLSDPAAIGDVATYWLFNGYHSKIYTWSRNAGHVPLLSDPDYSYDNLVTDKRDLAWTRSQGWTDVLKFDQVELWSAPVPTDWTKLQPRKIADLPEGASVLVIGDGWVMSRPDSKDVRLHSLTDPSDVRRVPSSVDWTVAASVNRAAIVNGELWSMGLDKHNDATGIFRFKVDDLPPFEEEIDGGISDAGTD